MKFKVEDMTTQKNKLVLPHDSLGMFNIASQENIKMNCRRRSWMQGLAASLLSLMAVNVSARAEEWNAHEVRQLGEPVGGDRTPAKLQIVTESWNRVVAVPYIVYMPEMDRLLMLVSCDYPHRPMVLTSNDHGASWSKPQPVLPDEPAHARHLLGVSLTYLGDGQVLCGVEGRLRCRSVDYGQTWSSEPIPPNSHGGGWNQSLTIRPNTWESGTIGYPHVLHEAGSLRVFYNGARGYGSTGIGMVTARMLD